MTLGARLARPSRALPPAFSDRLRSPALPVDCLRAFPSGERLPFPFTLPRCPPFGPARGWLGVCVDQAPAVVGRCEFEVDGRPCDLDPFDEVGSEFRGGTTAPVAGSWNSNSSSELTGGTTICAEALRREEAIFESGPGFER